MGGSPPRRAEAAQSNRPQCPGTLFKQCQTTLSVGKWTWSSNPTGGSVADEPGIHILVHRPPVAHPRNNPPPYFKTQSSCCTPKLVVVADLVPELA